MRAVAIANQKGGVGKTTTTYHLAVALREEGQRVLAIDLDPQAHLTLMAGIDLSSLEHSIYDVLANEMPAREVITRSDEGFDVLPSDQVLARAELQMATQYGRERRLKKALDPVRPAYDWALMDCPPSIGILTQNALVAADSVVVPVEPEVYAIKGMQLLLETIGEIREDNPALRVTTVVPTQVRRNKHHTEMINLLNRLYPELPVGSGIPALVAFGRAARAQQNIFSFAPKSTGARAYRDLAGELLAHAR